MSKFSSNKVAVISDLHLGVHSNSSHWHEIAVGWAEWLIGELMDSEVEDIVFCGDWYHHRSEISVATLQVSNDIMSMLSEHFQVFMILGNHDLYYKTRLDTSAVSLFDRWDNVHVFNCVETIEQFGRRITFCPWDVDMKLVDKCDVVFSHLELNTFRMNSSVVCDHGIKLSDVISVAPLIISGHFHTRQEKVSGDCKVLYVGNPFSTSFADVENLKGYYILDLEDNTYEFKENPISPKYVVVKLSDVMSDGFDEGVITNNIVKFMVDVPIEHEDLDKMIPTLKGFSPDNVEIVYETPDTPTISGDSDVDMCGINLHGAVREFIKMMRVENGDLLENYTINLLEQCITNEED